MWKDRLDKSRESGTAWVKGFGKRVKRWLAAPWHVFQRVCFYMGFTVFVGIGIAYFIVAGFFDSLPHVERMQLKDVQVLASKRVEAKVVNKRYHHRWVPLKDISRDLLFAIVMSEDSTFFEHNGFNFDVD